MPCYKPNVILLDKSTSPGKILEFFNGKIKGGLDYEYFEEINRLNKLKNNKEYIKVPCGKCIGCKEAKSKQWATRCSLENEMWIKKYQKEDKPETPCWFVTLTYNDEHLPREDELVNKKTGEAFQNDNWEQGHLVKEELSEFMKDLRAYYQFHYEHTGIRFFSCGEYGGDPNGTHRPHYHLIIFNLPIPTWELQIRKVDSNGNIHWTCEALEKCWEDKRFRNQHVSKGYVDICEVNWDTCAYVARYTCKKEGEEKTDEWYYEQGKTPEFINMSRRPGIGLDFFTQNYQDIYKNDEIIIKGHREKIQPVKPPQYYDRLYDQIDHLKFYMIKDKRKKIADWNTRSANAQTTLTEYERHREAEKLKKIQMNTLKRDKAYVKL